jgi:hypothetical protein
MAPLATASGRRWIAAGAAALVALLLLVWLLLPARDGAVASASLMLQVETAVEARVREPRGAAEAIPVRARAVGTVQLARCCRPCATSEDCERAWTALARR